MKVPEGTTEDYLDWDVQATKMDMVAASAIPQECVGERQTLKMKKWPEYHILIKKDLVWHGQWIQQN